MDVITAATEASNAFPPAFNISKAVSLASLDPVAIIPCFIILTLTPKLLRLKL